VPPFVQLPGGLRSGRDAFTFALHSQEADDRAEAAKLTMGSHVTMKGQSVLVARRRSAAASLLIRARGFSEIDLVGPTVVRLGYSPALLETDPSPLIGAGDVDKQETIKVKIGPFIQAASMGVAILMTAASASATAVTFTTNGALTEYTSGGTGLTLDNATGAAATLTFEADPSSTVTVPTFVDYGNFVLACTAPCTGGGTFGAFTFVIEVDDASDGATGVFTGTSAGGSYTTASSTIEVTWTTSVISSGVQLGQGSYNALSGNFGPTTFTIGSPSPIVAPNSGDISGENVGETTIQGFVTSAPEPATLGLVGGALMGLGMLRRKRFSRQ
jgi:hypothetical protein